ncbi:MAG: hypothetical protein ACE5E6_07460 [Phycisphaerae bacterium]
MPIEHPPDGVPLPPTAYDVACVGCGYNLRGLPSGGWCPECATPIALSDPHPVHFVVKPDVDTPVESPTPCVRCGDDLQQRTTHDACPTCGAPVWFSIHGDWLRASDPTWLARVRSGVTLWLWMLLASVVAGTTVGVIAMFLSFGGRNPGSVNRNSMLQGGISGLVVAAFLICVTWRITACNPATWRREPERRRRQRLRGLVLISATANTAFLVVILLRLPTTAVLVTSIATMAGTVVMIALLAHLRAIAGRIPNPKLQRSLGAVMWGYGISNILVQVMACVMIPFMDLTAAAPTGPLGAAVPNPTMVTLSCTMGLLGLAAFGFMIWLVVLLFRLRRAFAVAIQQVLDDTHEHAPDTTHPRAPR